MNKGKYAVKYLFVFGVLITFFLLGCNNAEEPEQEPEQDPNELLWGIDTASIIDEGFYACVVDHFGTPVIAGRYLGTKDGVSYGVSAEEIQLLHNEGVKLLLIYNHFTDATGYQNGVNMAEDAIRRAEEIGAPAGVAIFANIEPIYPVDAEFMMGWVETLSPSKYEAAIYGDFSEGHEVRAAFMEAIDVNPSILDATIVWTHQPQEGITTKDNAPEFNPGAPEEARAYIWQYGIDAEACNIDTNLFKRKLLDYLW